VKSFNILEKKKTKISKIFLKYLLNNKYVILVKTNRAFLLKTSENKKMLVRSKKKNIKSKVVFTLSHSSFCPKGFEQLMKGDECLI